MTARLSLRSETSDTGATVHLAGELDLTSSDDLASAVTAHFAEGGTVTLDCAELTFIDSTGLSSLVELHQAAEEARTALVLVEVPDHARRLMQITKIDGLLGI